MGRKKPRRSRKNKKETQGKQNKASPERSSDDIENPSVHTIDPIVSDDSRSDDVREDTQCFVAGRTRERKYQNKLRTCVPVSFMVNPVFLQFENDTPEAAQRGEISVSKMWILSTLPEQKTSSKRFPQENLQGLTSRASYESEGARPKTNRAQTSFHSTGSEQETVKETPREKIVIELNSIKNGTLELTSKKTGILELTPKKNAATRGAIPKRKRNRLADKFLALRIGTQINFLKNSLERTISELETENEQSANKLTAQETRKKSSSPELVSSVKSLAKEALSKTRNEAPSSTSASSEHGITEEAPPQQNVVDFSSAKRSAKRGARSKIRNAQISFCRMRYEIQKKFPPQEYVPKCISAKCPEKKKAQQRTKDAQPLSRNSSEPVKVGGTTTKKTESDQRGFSGEAATDKSSESTTDTAASKAATDDCSTESSSNRTIAQLKPFVYVLCEEKIKLYCSFCFKRFRGQNYAICRECNNAFYCNTKCKIGHFQVHDTECGYKKRLSPAHYSDFSRLLVQFMRKSECSYADDHYDVVDDQRFSLTDLDFYPYSMQKFPKYASICAIEYGRMRHARNFTFNYCYFCKVFAKCYKHHVPITDYYGNTIGLGVYLGLAAFEHSCRPNAIIVFDGNTACILVHRCFEPRNIYQITLRMVEVINPRLQRMGELTIYNGGMCYCSFCDGEKFEESITQTIEELEDESACERTLSFIEWGLKYLELEELRKCSVAFSALRNCTGEMHYLRVRVAEYFGFMQRQEKRYPQAIISYAHLVYLYKMYLGDDDPKTILTFLRLADCYAQIGAKVKAKQCYLMENVFEQFKNTSFCISALNGIVCYGTDNVLYRQISSKCK